MTDLIQEQISAFVDDELAPEECSFLVRRLAGDLDARRQIIRHAAIGSALRGDSILACDRLLLERINAELDGAARRPVVAPRAKVVRRSDWLHKAAGMAVAAGVAVAAVGLLRLGAPQAPGPATGGQPIPVAADVSYVVPADNGGSSQADIYMPPIRLTNYLVEHGNYAYTLGRRSVISNVVGTKAPDQVPGQPAEEEITE